MLQIVLPWPERILWPNARAFRLRVARVKAEHRALARAQALNLTAPAAPLAVVYTFCPPSRRRYDLDNALAAMKAMQDGVCEGLQIDDSLIAVVTLRRGQLARPAGQVVMDISAQFEQ